METTNKHIHVRQTWRLVDKSRIAWGQAQTAPCSGYFSILGHRASPQPANEETPTL